LLGPGTATSVAWKADGEIPARRTSEVRQSGEVGMPLLAGTVVIGSTAVVGRVVVDNDDRPTGGLVLVASVELGPGQGCQRENGEATV
jgi:exosome complex RNA-binding protein Rrp42 (RNase PH superfamily)